MSNEILSVLEYMEKEKGINRSDMIDAISAAIADAAHKGLGAGREIRVEINPRTGALKAWSILNVVDSVSDANTEMHVEKARQINKDAEVGGTVEKEVDPAFLGRIAAQTFRRAQITETVIVIAPKHTRHGVEILQNARIALYLLGRR